MATIGLKEIWDIYRSTKNQPEKAKEHKLALGVFLSMCCKETDLDKGFSIICNMKSIVNQLCNEFMNDIIRITNTAEDDGDPATLETYMVLDRGWQLLSVIHKLGVQGLTVGRDFSNLIVSLLPWCLRFRVEEEDNEVSPTEDSLPALVSCFTHLHKSTKWLKSCQQRDRVIPKNNRRKIQKNTENYKSKKHRADAKDKDSSNSDEDTLRVPQKVKKARNIFRRNPFVDFSGKTIKEEEEADDDPNEDIIFILSSMDISCTGMTPPDICHLILDLLLEICIQDLSQTSPTKFLSPAILPHLINVLTSFYPKETVAHNTVLASEWTKNRNIYFQRKLLRVVLTLCGVISIQQNGVNIITSHRCLQDLLEIALQIFNLQNIKREMSKPSSRDSSSNVVHVVTFDLELCFLSEIVLSIIVLLDIVFQCLPLNIVFINNAVKLARDFIQGSGFVLLDFVLGHLDCLRNQSYVHSDWSHSEPIKIIDSFLNTLKSVKVYYIHSVKCQRSKHQRCEYSSYFNHHHNILGNSISSQEPDIQDGRQQSETCLIALWCNFLLDVLYKMENKITRIEILKTLNQSAMCCCMKLEVVVDKVLKSFPKFSPPVQKYSLEILNAVVLESTSAKHILEAKQPKGFETTPKVPRVCSSCFDKGAQDKNETAHVLDSGFSSHGIIAETPKKEPLELSIGDLYKKVLFSKDQALTELVSKQLLTLVLNGSRELKEELFYKVYVFAFSSFLGTLRSKSPISSEEEHNLQMEFSKKVKVHSLSALPHLLESEVVLEEFLQNKGIGRICRLLEDENLRNPVLKVFEALVILDQDKLADTDMIYPEYNPGTSNLPKNGLVIKAFIGGLASMTATNTGMPGQTRDVNDFVQMFEDCDVQFCCQNFAEMMTKNVTLLVDMWETCARICLHSKKFVFHFQNSPCLKIAENALMMIIKQILCYNKCELPDGSEDSGLDADLAKTPSKTNCCHLQLMLMKSLLIVCSASYKSLIKKDGQEISMWRRLKDAFQACSKLPPGKAKTVCDILLSSAIPNKTTILDHNKLQTLSDLFIKDDDIDDDEIRQYIHSTSEDDYDSLKFGEGGYYGDTECGSDEKEAPMRAMDNGCGVEIYPAVFRILIELTVKIQHQSGMTDILGQILQKLLQTLRANHKATVAVCNEGLLEDILVGFWAILVNDQSGSTVRSSLSSLIQLLSQHRVTSIELQRILQLFSHSSIPQDILLSAFLSIIENSKPQPHYSVTFPCRHIMEVSPKSVLVQSRSHRSKSRSDSSGMQSSFFASVASVVIGSPDSNESIHTLNPTTSQDVWGIAAMFTPVNSLIWPPLDVGVTVASWVKLSEDQENVVKITKTTTGNHVYVTSTEAFGTRDHFHSHKVTIDTEECLHLVSIGNTEKMLEVWVHTSSGHLLIRLTTEYGSTSHVLRECVSPEILQKGQWHHVVISYSEEKSKSRSNGDIEIIGKVSLVFDGWKTHRLALDHQFVLDKRNHNQVPCLCVGHAMKDPDESRETLAVSSMMVFEGCNHGRDELFHLYALGLSCVTISKCDNVMRNISYGPILTKEMELHSKIPTELLAGSKPVNIDSLRSSLLVSYNPMMPDLVCYYRNKSYQESRDTLATNLGLTQRQNIDLLLMQLPITAQFTCQGKVIGHRHHGLEKALEGAGGMEAIVFLVAQVFEQNKADSHQKNSDHELLQSKALQILFSLVNFSTHLTKDYAIINGNQLLNRVLTSSRAVIGYQTVKVLLDAATSESMLRFEVDGSLVMRKKSEAIVTNISVISELLLNWRIWDGYDEDILVMIFHALASLVRDDHPHQDFNIKQFHSVSLINKIFKMYQERIQDGRKAYSAEIGQSVISLLQSMLGTPPDLQLIASVLDFLIFVHPATNSYVNHQKTSFYFTTWWNEKSPRIRKDSTFVKHSLNLTSTPHNVQTKRSSSSISEESKAKRSLDLNTAEKSLSDQEKTVVYKPDSDVDTAAEASEKETTNTVTELKPVTKTQDSTKSKDQERTLSHCENGSSDAIETVSDLERSDSTSQTSNEHENSPRLQISLELSLESKTSVGSPEVTSPFTDKMNKLSMLKKIGAYTSSSSLSREMSTDDEEGLYAPRPEVAFDDDEEEYDAEKGLVALCVGLLETLTNVVLTLPDIKLGDFLKVIRPDIALVLSHHSSPQIRTAIIKLISSYLVRAGKDHIEEFIQKQYFQLLSVQLHSYPTHTEQVEGIVSFIVGKPFSFEFGTNFDEIEEPHELQQASFVVFLSLIENTYRDIALCHNTLALTLKLYECSNVFGCLLLENKLIEVITNLVARINSVTTRCTDMDGIDEYQLILEDIQLLLHAIVVREFSTSGLVHIQQCEEILEILTMLENIEEIVYGKNSKQSVTVKTLQYSIVMSILTFVEHESQEKPSQTKPRQLGRSTSSTSVSYANQITLAFPNTASRQILPSPSSPAIGQSRANHFTDEPMENMTGRLEGHYSRSTNPMTIVRAFSVDSKSTGILGSIFRFGKKNRFEVSPFSQSEFIDRLKKWIVIAVDLIVYSKLEEIKKTPGRRKLNLFEKSEPITIETKYIRRLFEFLYRALELTLAQDRVLSKREKNVILWGAKDVIRVQTCRLVIFMLSPRCQFDDRAYILSYIQGEVRGREILKILLGTSSDVGLEMGIFIHNLCTTWADWLNTQQKDYAYQFLNILKSEKVTVFSPSAQLTEQQLHNLNEEKRSMAAKIDQGREQLRKKKKPVHDRMKSKNDKLCQELSKHAMDVTQSVTQLQTQERNKMVEHVKKKMTEKIQIKKLWQELVQTLTHERAVWYNEKSYPKSWQLDPTEGPGRVRKRLKRCHLGLEPRFLNPDYRGNLESEYIDPPLIYLFEDDHQVSDSAALIYQLYRNEKIQHTCKCTAVAPNSESKGELLVGENSVFFVADEAITDANYTQVLLGNKDQLSMTWPYDEIREIHKRWYLLRDCALEIFLTNGRTCLLACVNKIERDELHQRLLNFELSNLILTENIEMVQKSWMEGQMTNYEYLTHLNKLAGRSFNDLMQYPVFPFILKDYVSQRLNLLHPEAYRNLSKPISVQDKSREEKYKEKYKVLKASEFAKNSGEQRSPVDSGPYHYGSHYSNSGIVLHFLVRLPPFTKMLINYQDNNFDLPDRTFHNMETCWKLASFQSSSDFKEMIPEFFFLPEFLKNFEGFAFGQRQNNDDVFDVILPPWCKNNPRLFVMILQQALESDYVRLNLHHWIDLVFGYKQQGEAAIKAINVFHPATYFGIDVDSVPDRVTRNALQAMVKTYGQTPKQLFKMPHPQGACVRENTSEVISQLVQTSYNVRLDRDFDRGFASYVPCPLDSVDGMKWGTYIGSPANPPPQVVWQQKYSQVVASLLPLPTGDVIGVGMETCCLTMNSKQKVSTLYNTTDVVWAAIVTWKFPDGILRINNKPDQPYLNLVLHSPYDRVTYIASIADSPYLFVGCESGSIAIYQTVFNSAKASDILIKGVKQVLYGHTRRITQIVICKAYSIFVSASEDKTCIIWDLNKLSYVRSIEGHTQSVDVVAISSTSGDIASACRHGLGSCLKLHTINGEEVASYTSQDHVINCLAFSTAPEGQSINVVAGGLDNGVIRIWSTIDLRHLRDLQTENLMLRPVISITFTFDSQRLYSSLSDGTVALWESPTSNKHLLPHKFVAFLG